MLLLGIDLGTSFIKVSVVDAGTKTCIASAQYPDAEAEIIALQPGWAEQDPNIWWSYIKSAILKCNNTKKYNPKDIAAIGIAYQMHGLVVVDRNKQVLRNSIIWCDSRAVPIGDEALQTMGNEYCLSHLLNAPGNFTASKLVWVKNNEPQIYGRIAQVMLPGDFVAMQLTGAVTTTASALSEGIFWDFKNDALSDAVINHFHFDRNFIPAVQPLFSVHGFVQQSVAEELGLKPNIPVSYKAGDQPNNAFSLNVLQPGEVAATAGTSGVIYGVSDVLKYDPLSRINSFAHVNYENKNTRIGVLLCINGAGIFYKYIRNMLGGSLSYDDLNAAAAKVAEGADGLTLLPFGNGAERMLQNKTVGAQVHGLDLNRHNVGHWARAAQEGIAFAFRYGLDIMRENGMNPSVVRAGKANLFLSDVFTQSFANTTELGVELHHADGSVGAALGAGVGAGIFNSPADAFANAKVIKLIEPKASKESEAHYQQWKAVLETGVAQGRER